MRRFRHEERRRNGDRAGWAAAALTLIAAACGGAATGDTTTTGVVASDTMIVATSTTTATTRAAPAAPAPTTAVTTTTAAAPDRTVEEVANVFYTDRQQLDVFAPDGGAEAVVIVLHGRGGDRQRFEHQARDIAAAGAVVYNVSWRYRPPRFLEGMEDVACAVRYARATASEYGGDAKRVVIVGFSAGAWAGAVVGLSGDHAAPSCRAEAGSTFPDALVGVSGAYDVATTGPAAFLESVDPETWAAINPFLLVGGNPAMKVRLVHGSDDPAVPLAVAAEFEAALRDASYDVSLVTVEGGVHLGGAELMTAAVASTVAVMTS